MEGSSLHPADASATAGRRKLGGGTPAPSPTPPLDTKAKEPLPEALDSLSIAAGEGSPNSPASSGTATATREISPPGGKSERTFAAGSLLGGKGVGREGEAWGGAEGRTGAGAVAYEGSSPGSTAKDGAFEKGRAPPVECTANSWTHGAIRRAVLTVRGPIAFGIIQNTGSAGGRRGGGEL